MACLYFFIALGATTLGALTGMGGGVIIKPLCDMIGTYDAETIGVLACITVFAMAVVSLGKQLQQKARFEPSISIPLSIGAVLGGNFGQQILSHIAANMEGRHVTITQNICLALVIGVVFWYMLNKQHLPSLTLKGMLPAVLAGLVLGFFSSFLGIGGGPINVALTIFLFSFDTKKATICSILTILFAQISKIVTILCSGGFGRYDLSSLPMMVVGAILGGFLGAKLNKQLPQKKVEYAFHGVQICVLILCITNIIRNF